MVRETGIELLLGSDQIDHSNKSYYNAAFLVRKDGNVAGVYQKMHLVPFGEFVPLQRLLVLCWTAGGSRGCIHARRADGHAADEPWANQHRHLL